MEKMTAEQPTDNDNPSKSQNDVSSRFLGVDNIQRSRSPSTLSNFSVDDRGRLPSERLGDSRQTLQRFRQGLKAFWVRNKGLALVLAAQIFNCLMNVIITILEIEGNNGKGFHPLQVLFVRMGITVVLSSTYMAVQKTRDFPLGAKEVRPLLIARGFGGFFGVFGMYYSLMYLPLADATVITFLAPVIACAVCAYILKEPFSRMEQVAASLSMLGVVLIARPTAIFSYFQSGDAQLENTVIPETLGNSTTASAPSAMVRNVTPQQKVMAVAVAMVGVLGGATVITTLRWIGKRAHPLITVNYFAAWVVIVSGVLSAAIPSIGFAAPTNPKEWLYLVSLGICGFTSQTLGAAGLQYEKSSRATNMIYSQMLFALAMDKMVFRHSPELLSIVGSGLILGSAIYVAVRKDGTKAETKEESERPTADEESGLMQGIDAEDGDSEDVPMREIRV